LTLRTPDAARTSPALPLVRGNRVRVLQAAAIVLLCLYVYCPAIRGGWLWDDHEIRNNPTLHSWAGLGKIWVAPAATDYIPLEASVLWAEWHLWGDAVAGYHAANIAFHLLGAFLLWRLLGKLGVRLAWLGALLFAIHPVAVESVAWISEVKNTVSLPPLLTAACLWIDFADTGRRRTYLLSLACFLAALLCKGSVVMFPGFILLHAWWRRGRVGWPDIRAALPFLAAAVAIGLVTIHFQEIRAIRDWRTPEAGFLARAGGAGLALDFYFWKCVVPGEVMPVYPRWSVGATSPLALIPWLLAVVMTFLLLRRGSPVRPASRHLLLGLGWFVLFLLPVLGFVTMSYQHIAPVADHLAYISLAGVVGLAAAGAGAADAAGRPWFRAAAAAVVAALAIGSHRYARVFASQETLWTYNAAHNPGSAVVFANLGLVQDRAGRTDEAIENYERAIALDPADPDSENELAGVLARRGRAAAAIRHYERAISLYRAALARDPGLQDVNNKLGLDLVAVGRAGEALGQFEEAVRKNPGSYEDQTNLANVLAAVPGRLGEAIDHFGIAARLNPDSLLIRRNFGYALAMAGRFAEARAQFGEALRIDPGDPESRSGMARLRGVPDAP